MAILFLEPGTDSTQDFKLWSSTSGTVSSATDQAHTGGRSIKCDSTASNVAAYVQRNSVLTQAGTTVSWWFYASALPATSPRVLSATTIGGTTCFTVECNSAGHLVFVASGGSTTGSATLSAGQWYRLTLAWTISSTTVNEFRLFVDGTLDVTVTNRTLANAATGNVLLGMVQAFGANKAVWIDDIYIDNSTTLADPGDVRCTHKGYVGTSEGLGNNAWDTFIGTNRSTGLRYLNVSERPAADTNGWQQAGTAQQYEKYLIEGAAAGDVDLSGATLVGWLAWVRAKTSASSSVASLVDNDTDTTISTSTTISQFLHATTSSSYPTGRFGMRATGTATDTFFYEGGVIVAYIPGGGGAPTVQALAALGVG